MSFDTENVKKKLIYLEEKLSKLLNKTCQEDSTSIVVPAVTDGNLIATHFDGQGEERFIQETITEITKPNSINELSYQKEGGTSDLLDIVEQVTTSVTNQDLTVGVNGVESTVTIPGGGDLTENGQNQLDYSDGSGNVDSVTILKSFGISHTQGNFEILSNGLSSINGNVVGSFPTSGNTAKITNMIPISKAEHDALVLANNTDPETYYVIIA